MRPEDCYHKLYVCRLWSVKRWPSKLDPDFSVWLFYAIGWCDFLFFCAVRSSERPHFPSLQRSALTHSWELKGLFVSSRAGNGKWPVLGPHSCWHSIRSPLYMVVRSPDCVEPYLPQIHPEFHTAVSPHINSWELKSRVSWRLSLLHLPFGALYWLHCLPFLTKLNLCWMLFSKSNNILFSRS